MRLRKLVAAAVVAAAAFGALGATAAEDDGWTEASFDALETHIQLHPKLEAQDVYKFLFQAVLGPGHAIPSRLAAASYLAAEVENLSPTDAPEQMCEPLGGSPAMVRIHLRPYLADNGDSASLLDAFVASAEEVVIDRGRFEHVLASAPQWLEDLGRPDLAADLERLTEQMRARDLPALHHSQVYGEAYGPAYRVILRTEASARGWCSAPTTR